MAMCDGRREWGTDVRCERMGSLFLKTRMHESHLRWHLKASCDEISFFFFLKEKACCSVSLSIGQKKKMGQSLVFEAC